MKPQKDGPKRRRNTRRELPYGQISLWMHTANMKRERELRLLELRTKDQDDLEVKKS